MASRFVLTAQVQLQAPTNTRQVVNQIQQQLRGVNVQVNLKGGQQASRQINNLNKATKQVTTQATKMGKAFGASVRRFGAFTIATRAISLFTSGLANATKEAIDFEREMIKISQVTGKTMGELKGLENTITSLATSLGVSSKSILSVGRILSQAGIQAKDLKVALTTLAKTELAPTFEDITKTAEGAVAILAQFGQGVGELERQLGAINRVAGQFAVESGDLISVIRRTGGVFKAAGGDLEELIALFTSVRATTRESAESIATGLRTIFTRIQRPKTIEFLKQFGVQLTDLNGKFIGPFEAVKQLSAALSGLEQGDIRFVKIAEELGGFRQIGKVIPLLQQFEIAERARQAALEGGDSLNKDAAKAQAALAVQISKVKEEFLALIRSFTQTSSFQTFVKSSLELASALIKIADALKPLVPLLATFAALKFARGAAGFARGIGAGIKGGGSPTGFARGGVVPGTGNRDTVPAMLTPGEFVIRKSSVKSLGTDTLAQMNQNKFNRGTVNFSGVKRELDRQRGTSALDFKKGTTIQAGKGGTGTLTAAIGQADALADLDPYQAVFLRPQARGKQFKGKILKGNLRKAVSEALKGTGISSKQFDPQTKAGVDKIAERYASRNQFSLTAGSLSAKKSQNLESMLLKGIFNSAKKGAKFINKSLGIQGEKNIATALRSANIDQVLGNLFEVVLTNAGAPFGFPDTDPPNAPFDFPKGLGPVAKDFKLKTGIATEAKSFFSEGNLSTINKKVQNQLINESVAELRQIYTNFLVTSGKAVSLGDAKKAFGSTRLTRDDISKLASQQGLNFAQGTGGKYSFTRRNAGGGIAASDTVPALLTPGEFVFNKKAAKSIGYSNLGRMNRQGVKGFAAGGVVTQGRHNYGIPSSFQIPGFPAVSSPQPFGANADALDKFIAKAEKLAKANERLSQQTEKNIKTKSRLDKIEQKFRITVKRKDRDIQKAFDNITNKSAKQLAKGLADLGTRGVKGLIRPFAALAKGATSASGKLMGLGSSVRKGGGSMAGGFMRGLRGKKGGGGGGDITGSLFALSMIGSMVPDIKDAKDGFSAGANELKNFVLQTATVAFALSSFGAKLSSFKFQGSSLNALRNAKGARTSAARNAFMDAREGGASKAQARRAAAGARVGTGVKQGAAGLGKLALAAGVAALAVSGLVKIVDAFTGVNQKAKDAEEKAIKTGSVADIQKAEEAAAAKASAGAMNKVAMGAAAAGAGLGFLVGGPFGAAIGGAIGAIGGFALKIADSGGALGEFLKPFKDFMVTLGLAPSAEQAKAQAGFTIAAARAQKELAESAKEAAEELKLIQTGQLSATQSLGAGGAAARGAQAISAQTAAGERLIKANQQNLATVQGNPLGGFIAKITGREAKDKAEQKRIEQQNIKSGQDFIASQGSRFAAATKEQVVAASAAGGTTSFNDFLSTLDPSIRAVIENTDKMNGNSDEMDKLRKNFENQKKAVLENIKFIKAMNFGLSEVTSGITAYSSSLNNLAAAQQTGFSTAAFAAETLGTAISSAGKNINSAQLGQSLNALEDNLKKFGANAKQITDARALITGLNDLQKNASDALLAVKAGFKGGSTSPEVIKNQLRDAIVGSIPDSSPIKQKLIDSFGKLELPPEAIQEFLNTGDVSVILDKAFGPIQEQVEKQLLGPLKEMAKQEKILVGLTQKRREAEQKLISVQKKAIDTQIEAAKSFEFFGGASFTPEKELDARRQQANLVLRDAGVSGLAGGSTADIRAASDQIFNRFSAQQQLQNAAAAGGGGAFGGVEGVDKDRREELKASNQALITFTKQSIEARKKELELINKKNEAEKQALQSLLSGDVESFFDQAIGAAAGSALRSGNAQAAGLFGAGALGKGLQGIQGTVSDAENKRAASIAFGAFGLGDNAARVFTGNTREQERIKSEGRELSLMQGELAGQSAAMEQMTVDAKEVVITAANVRLGEISNQVSSAQSALNFNRGGTVYANKGMFIPRGTDTVPAMLTPGEFVVNRSAVQRGNNLQILRSMNSNSAPIQAAQGLSSGGPVRYRANGSTGPEGPGGIDFSKFEEMVNKFQEVTDKLGNVNIKHMFEKLGTLDINHMFNGNMQQAFKDEILAEAGDMMSRSKFSNDGSITTSDRSVLG